MLVYVSGACIARADLCDAHESISLNTSSTWHSSQPGLCKLQLRAHALCRAVAEGASWLSVTHSS